MRKGLHLNRLTDIDSQRSAMKIAIHLGATAIAICVLARSSVLSVSIPWQFFWVLFLHVMLSQIYEEHFIGHRPSRSVT